MMLVRALERSKRVLGAMKCRGFSGRIHIVDRMSFSLLDIRFAVAVLVAIAALIILERADAVPY
jgi:cobalt/nickel transport system permease protein